MTDFYVNATALDEGGALTILNQFVKNLEGRSGKYVVFVSDRLSFMNSKSVTFIKVDMKSWLKRIYWDSFGFARYLRKLNVDHGKVVSLQNTSVNTRFKQYIYLHQPLPFTNEKFSFLKSDQRKLFLYQRLYSFFIFLFLRHDTEFVVQTEWVKRALIEIKPSLAGRVHVFKPELPTIDIAHRKKDSEIAGYKSILFPASSISYKNHLEVVDAVILLKQTGKLPVDFRCLFTVHRNDLPLVSKKISDTGTERYFVFLGGVNYERMMQLYESTKVVVFPSYVETFGLPLVEASAFGLPIVAIDRPFSREVLNGYSNVEFVPKGATTVWADAIVKSLSKKKVTPYGHTLGESGWKCFFDLIEES